MGAFDALFDAAAAQEHGAFERLAVQALRRGHHDLLDLGPGGRGARAQLQDVDRRLAPAVEIEARTQDFRLDDGTGGFLGAEVGARQEDLADEDRARTRRMADQADLFAKEILRDADHDAGAIARLAVGVDRATVEQGLQRAHGQFDDLALGRAVDRADEADTAGVLFGGRVIGVAIDEALALVEIVLVGIEISHGLYSAA